jgi:alkylhydroperoxidase family enzyme
MQKVDAQAVAAIRARRCIPDLKLEALRRLTVQIVTARGRPSREALTAFIEAGYGEAQILEVVFGVGLKTIASYVNHIGGTKLDDVFAPFAWSKP